MVSVERSQSLASSWRMVHEVLSVGLDSSALVEGGAMLRRHLVGVAVHPLAQRAGGAAVEALGAQLRDLVVAGCASSCLA